MPVHSLIDENQTYKDGLKGLEGLDFGVKIGCEQDDVSSPLSWVAVLEILLSALEDEENLVLAFDCEDPMKRSKEMGE